jgi:hypothetical protein
MGRLVWYVVFSLIVLGVLALLRLPSAVIGAYLVIAAVGLVMAVRDMRVSVREEFRREIAASGDRLVGRIAASQAAAKRQPWFEEVEEAQNKAVTAGASIIGLFTSYNPYLSLSYPSLVRYGLTSWEEIKMVKATVAEGPPQRWMNPMMVNDMTRGGQSEDEALVRIGLWMINESRFDDEAVLKA